MSNTNTEKNCIVKLGVMLPQLFEISALGIMIMEYVHLPQVSRWIIHALQTNQDDIASEIMRIRRTCDSLILKECCVQNKLSLLLRWYSRSHLGQLVAISQSLQTLLLQDDKYHRIVLYFQDFFTQPIDQHMPNACLFPLVINDDIDFKKHVKKALKCQNAQLLLRVFAHANTISHHVKEQIILKSIKKTYVSSWKAEMIECLCSLPFDRYSMVRQLKNRLSLSSLCLHDHAAYEALYAHGVFALNLDYFRFKVISNSRTAAMFYNADCILTKDCLSSKINAVARTHILSPIAAWNVFLRTRITGLEDEFFSYLTSRHLGLVEGSNKKFVLRCANAQSISGLKWAAKYLSLDNDAANECLLRMSNAEAIFLCVQAWHVTLDSQTIDRLTHIALIAQHLGLWSMLVNVENFKKNIQKWTKQRWKLFSQVEDVRFVESIWEKNAFWRLKSRFLFMKALESRCKEQAHYWFSKCQHYDSNVLIHVALNIFRCELWDLLAYLASKVPPSIVEKCYKHATIKSSQHALEFLERMWPQQEAFFLENDLLSTSLHNDNYMFVCFFYRIGRLSGDTLIFHLRQYPRYYVLEHLNFDIDAFVEPLNIVETIYFKENV